MKGTLQNLQDIHSSLLKIGNDIRLEGRVCADELADRLQKGLKGAAAIEHYNQWMANSGMEHLMIK